MKTVKAPEDILDSMKELWRLQGKLVLDDRTDKEKRDIVDNLRRILVFCRTEEGFYMEWVNIPLHARYHQFVASPQPDQVFVKATMSFLLKFGLETAAIRGSKLFGNPITAVWTILTLLHPIPKQRAVKRYSSVDQRI